MKKIIIGTIVFLFGIFYGVMVHRDHIFPYSYLRGPYEQFIINPPTHGPWSIGMYEGNNPFDLTPQRATSNPVLSGKNVNDIDASFVADPFLVIEEGKYFMFFEAMNRERKKGEIAYAESTDGKVWLYKKIIIREKFHLSYPYVFKWNGDYYLIPESNMDLSVRLYKAIDFPEKWQYVSNLISGYRYLDPSIFFYGNNWWLFVATPQNNVLNLYYSKNLLDGWKPHPMNPIIKFDKNIARPGGRILNHDGHLYRFTQDDDPRYGIQVFAFEITELSERKYTEKIVKNSPLVGMSGTGWNATGMHHVDLHKLGDKWIAAVDGRN